MSARRMDRTVRNVGLISGIVLVGLRRLSFAVCGVRVVSLPNNGRIRGHGSWPSPRSMDQGSRIVSSAVMPCRDGRYALRPAVYPGAVIMGSRADRKRYSSPLLLLLTLLPGGETSCSGVDDDILYRLATLWPT